jgi:hypothetical protein
MAGHLECRHAQAKMRDAGSESDVHVRFETFQKGNLRILEIAALAPMYEVLLIDLQGRYSQAFTVYEIEDLDEAVDTVAAIVKDFLCGPIREEVFVDRKGNDIRWRLTLRYGMGDEYSLTSGGRTATAFGLGRLERVNANSIDPPSTRKV